MSSAHTRPSPPTPTSLPPATRARLLDAADLKAGEEVVLGWEWDDGCVIHQMPAVLTTPGMFPMRDRILDLGPLIGAKRGFRTRELVPGSGGLGGVVVWPYDDNERRTTREEIVDEEETEDELELPSPDPRKHCPSSHRAGPSRIHMPRGRPPDPPVDVRHAAAAVPPKMRKGWMRQASRDVDMASPHEDHPSMPPPRPKHTMADLLNTTPAPSPVAGLSTPLPPSPVA
ncbi:hypothetical protein H0H87_003943 [Tephrocybe sp. NHM501043]|nr:hypothetical protein H0H87_003943 [Tephrocybe sp. NHM501043]